MPRPARRAVVLAWVLTLAWLGWAVPAADAQEPTVAEDPEQPCSTGTRSISGTVTGEDGRFVSAQVSFELFDASGQLVDMDGCPRRSAAYPATTLVNNRGTCCFVLPAAGSESTPFEGVDLSTSWTLTGIPDNVAQIWVETYTKRAGGQPNSSTERYGHSIRRVPFAEGDVSGIDIVQPLRCGLSGGGVSGSTGALTGAVYRDGQLVTPTRVSAFSTVPDDGNGGAHLSFNVLGTHPTGRFLVDALAPGTYTIFVTVGDLGRRIDGLRVEPCGTSIIDVAVSGTVPTAAGRPVVGDWDADGGSDVGAFRPSSREWRVRDSASAGPVNRQFGFGGPGDVPVVGDWNGDGADDIGIFRPATREWLLRDSATGGAVQRRFGFGGAGDVPVVGDWDGDGVDGIGVYRPSTREWLLRETATGGGVQRRFGFGGLGDRPVVGDWNGDGIDGIGVFRPSGRQWMLRETASGGGLHRSFGFGGAGDLPVVGDWNGDGADGIGVFRPASSAWLLRNVAGSGGLDLRFTYDGR
jgi:hypothetical protein